MSSSYQGVKQSGRTILMKLTSRERPDQLLRVVSKYIELANNTKDMVWLFSFDEDDATCNYDFNKRLFEILPKRDLPNVCIYNKQSKGKIDAINRDVNRFELDWQILLNISDDQVPVVKGYDDIIRRTMPDDLDASLWFSDGVQPRINTQEILGKAYYDRFGYIYNPDYLSFFCDNEATDVAQKLGKMIRSNQCLIKHEHYAAGFPERKDALYTRNDKHWKHDEDLYKQRKQVNFNL